MSEGKIEFIFPDIPTGPAASIAVEELSTKQLMRAWRGWERAYQPYDKGDYILQAIYAELWDRGEWLFLMENNNY
ncbi:hypothetical protein [Ancylobacter oerskovii]|uniref:Uncharacterized protein n=1 Tax=Ancylobacter oerskovii TaxID=459519 RepID=A0ABW4Z5I9_9HYPH|nr:hypothetical protein [Ancylobacter oerskovii]MBS7543218.1 hypothetical protein [Ancylobacter oerskovii]